MNSYIDRLVEMYVGESITYQGEIVTHAVRALSRIEKASPAHFYSTDYFDRDSVTITREGALCDATRGRRSGGAKSRQWPFTQMMVGRQVVYTGADVPAAIRRLGALRGQHPDLFFKTERPDHNTVVITRVDRAAHATRQHKNRHWPFKYMGVGISVGFDVTFLDTERRLKIGSAARSCGQSTNKAFRTKTDNTADGRRIITVTRIS
jgi:hypothetical protein